LFGSTAGNSSLKWNFFALCSCTLKVNIISIQPSLCLWYDFWGEKRAWYV